MMEKILYELPLRVVRDNECNEMFRRRSGGGWYSGDGTYSIPLDGDDSFGSSKKTKTFWLFSDTHICDDLDTKTFEVIGDRMINHSVAIMNETNNKKPNFNDMSFRWGYKGDFSCTNIFGERMWALDGISIDNTIYIFMLQKDGDGNSGVWQVQIPIKDNDIDLKNYKKRHTPLFYKDKDVEIRLGIAILDNTRMSGSLNPDGYVYVYGVKRKPNLAPRDLIVARVKREDFIDFSLWEYYDGKDWISDFGILQSDTVGFSNVKDMAFHCSVTPLSTGIYKGKYMLINMKRQKQPVVVYRIGETPIGPWSESIPCHYVDEVEAYDIRENLVYNAKAHPHLSEKNELLVSYCVNVNQPDIKTNDKNRARFIRIKLDEISNEASLYLVSEDKKATSSGYKDSENLLSSNFKKMSQKWIDDTKEDKWIQIDLGKKYYVSRWNIIHLGETGENRDLITKDFSLHFSYTGFKWYLIDEVKDNTLNRTDRRIPEIGARYWRVSIEKSNQINTSFASLFNVNLYGRTVKSWGRRPSIDICYDKEVTVGNGDNPQYIVDNNTATKWESNTIDITKQWFEINLGGKHNIFKWILKTASLNGEKVVYNISDFDVMVSTDRKNWTTIDSITYNIGAIIERETRKIPAQYVKVKINKPTQSEEHKARVYGFEVHGYPLVKHDDLARDCKYQSSGYDYIYPVYQAFDNDIKTKWADSQESNKWIAVDLEEIKTISRWVVKHAGYGREDASRNTKDFRLQKSLDGKSWIDVDVVTDNTENVTDRKVTSFSAKYIRLLITAAMQSDCVDNKARIYGFELYS